MAEKKSRGGQREGAGRPFVEVKRKLRALEFHDEEWTIIKENAKKRGFSAREYLWTLVEADK